MNKSDIFFRIFAIVIVATISCISLVACFGSITDPESSMQFVRHIFSMDTTYKSPMLMWRAIDMPALHWAGFVAILLIEAVLAIAGLIGVYKMLRHLCADEETFATYKFYGYIAMALAVMVWGFIFQAAGGEWFSSWQSESWNGLRDATRIVLMAIGGGIVLRLAK